MTATAFVLDNTRPLTVAEAPDITLYLADEITPLWEVTDSALTEGGVAPPYWAFAWPGSRAFALLLRDDPAIVAGKRVLDVASGCGLAALVAARAGAAAVSANDIDPHALTAIRLAAELNGLVVNLLEGDLTDWPPERVTAEVVLIGDVCYEFDTANRFKDWLKALARLGKAVYLADPSRKFGPVADGSASGFEPVVTYSLETSLDLETTVVKQTTIWRACRD
ncbi:methyltransferase domain-containing protein [Fodinicurvata sp. EGI_FJ10296]|uniref:class I SAM-dependent methyltransferase n=1 Tax=Fodinicurvata sp. EGI_FJ10296 TaxID=3231908 RepID=UPI0034525E82